MGNLNIDIQKITTSTCKIFAILYIEWFNRRETYFQTASGTSVYGMLTNMPRSFHKTALIEAGFSDC